MHMCGCLIDMPGYGQERLLFASVSAQYYILTSAPTDVCNNNIQKVLV